MSNRGLTLAELLVGLTVLALIGTVLFAGFGGCYNATGANQKKATKEAESYIQKLNEGGIKASFLGCLKDDSDGDGFVTCEIIEDGVKKQIQCAAKSVGIENDGCKEMYPVKIPVVRNY